MTANGTGKFKFPLPSPALAAATGSATQTAVAFRVKFIMMFNLMHLRMIPGRAAACQWSHDWRL